MPCEKCSFDSRAGRVGRRVADLRTPRAETRTGRGHPRRNRPRLDGFTLQPFDRRFRLYLLALVIFTLGNSSDAFLLVRAGELGVATWLLPILWCLFHVVKSGGNMLGGRMVDRFGPRPMILLGWIYYAGIYRPSPWPPRRGRSGPCSSPMRSSTP